MKTIAGISTAKFLLCVVLGVAAIRAQQPERTPSSPTAHPCTIADTLKYQDISETQVSPDGRRVAFVVSVADLDENTIRTNIHLVDADGRTFKLTNALKHDDHPRWSPDGKWIAFVSDRPNKPEKSGERQVWRISPEGGEATQLTREKFKVSAIEWSPDGRKIALLATDPDPEELEKRKKDKDDALVADTDLKLARLHLADVATGKCELLHSAGRHITSISFSPDGAEIAFAEQPTPKAPDSFFSVVRAINVNDKKVRNLGDEELANDRPVWSPDGKWLAFAARSRTNWAVNNQLCVIDAAGGRRRSISAALDEHVVNFVWAADAQSLYLIAARRMDQPILRADLDGTLTAVHEPTGVCRSLHQRGGSLVFVHETPARPAELYMADTRASSVGAGAGPARSAPRDLTAKKLTHLNPWLADVRLGHTETFGWKNKNDGLDLEGLVVYPPEYVAGRRLPLLLVIHGGPAGVFNRNFVLRRGVYPVQVFASAGYIQFFPNPRGSGGYGERFRRSNEKDWGGADFDDIQHGVDALISAGIADPERMGVMGWSYGGYMTSWTITRTSRFKAASIGAAVTNLISFYGTTDIPPFQESYFGGAPWQTFELIKSRSAMSYVDRITTPSLIQHGQNDLRVPLSQGVELYTALRRRNVPVEMVQYPRMPHGIIEPKLARDAMQRNVEWFERYVLGNAGAAPWHKPPPKDVPAAQ